eukprot:jgi/Botrbrau1/8475/Bobra.0237s0091.1
MATCSPPYSRLHSFSNRTWPRARERQQACAHSRSSTGGTTTGCLRSLPRILLATSGKKKFHHVVVQRPPPKSANARCIGILKSTCSNCCSLHK